jgi:hypothetical protein
MLDEATLTVEKVRERLEVFKDPRFRFDPEPHEYWLGDRLLTSATGLVKKFHKPFIAADQAPFTARKLGWTVEEVLADWDLSGWIGSRMHEYIEWYYDGLVPDGYYHEDPEVALRCRKFHVIRQARLQDFIPVGQEIRMFYEAAGLSGTLDFLGLHKPTGKLWVLDWKSNKHFSTDTDKAYDNFYEPFSELAVNKLNEYSMQTSVYRIFLESIGIPTVGACLIHIPTGEQPPKLYPAKDFRERLRFLFT